MLNRTAYQCVVVGLLLTMMGVLTGLFSPGQTDTDLGVVSTQLHLPVILGTASIYAILLWNLVADPQRYLSSMRQQFWLLPLLAICGASALWSSDPSLVLRRFLFLCLTALAGLMLGTDFKILQIGRMLAAASALHLVLCAVFFLVARHYLFSPEDPIALKGLTTHKNVFGLEQGLALIAFAFCPFRRFKILRWPLVALTVVTLVWSHSSGSFIATAAALAVSPFLLVSKLNRRERVPAAAMATAGISAMLAIVVLNIDRIPQLFSKDSTFTGRTELWTLVLVAIHSRPWLGFGFDSFWRGLEGDSLAVIRGVGWLVPTAHNGYLDLLLSIGIVGAVFFGIFLLQLFARGLSQTSMGEDSSRYFPLVFLTLMVVYNLNESALLTRSGLPFLLMVALTTSIASHRVSHPSDAYARRSAMTSHSFPLQIRTNVAKPYRSS